jgi:3-hydroxyisobutyrate dehydrogenase-like beta-hydroxyacid dehydrogenase
LDQENGIRTLEKRARVAGIRFASMSEVIGNSDYLLSAVTTQVAAAVAEKCAIFLGAGKVYVDLNSTSPSVKVKVSNIISPSGADFVEGAILGAIGATGADTKILLGGEQAEAADAVLRKLGLKTSVFSNEIGKASMFKMLRSIFSKGMEAMLIELLLAAKCAGIDRELWQDIVETMSKTPFEKTASNWVQTHAPACERRYHEMVQVIDTMKEIGVEPIVTRGTTELFKRSMALGLNKVLMEKSGSMDEVIRLLQERLR